MQKSSWHRGESFVVQPKPGIDPKTTVSELFATGPMRLVVIRDEDHQAVLEASLPETLEVSAGTQDVDGNSDSLQGDLFADQTDTFNHFLQEESERVEWEAATIQDLKEERSKQTGE